MQILAYVLTTMLTKLRGERGQDLIEYALLSGLIAAALLAAFTAAWATGALGSMATEISDCLDFKSTTPCTIKI